MYGGHSIGVVVPAYDEEEFIGDVIGEIPDYVDRLFVIDDDSNDDTWEAIQIAAERQTSTVGETRTEPTPAEHAVGAESAAGSTGSAGVTQVARTTHPNQNGTLPNGCDQPTAEPAANARCDTAALADRIDAYETLGTTTRIRHDENRGAGGAIKTGYLAAIDEGVDIIATIDGDGQMDCATLSELLDPLVEGEADYAKGNRFYTREVARKMPTFRLVGNLMLTGLTRISSGYWRLEDPQNGFTAATRETLVDADIESLWTYYGYMNQLMARFNVDGVRIADVPMETTYGNEQSNIEYATYIRNVSWLLLQVFLIRLVNKEGTVARSTAACYCLGALSAIGTVGTAVRQPETELEPSRVPISLVCAVVSVVSLLAGIVLDSRTSPRVIKWEDD